MDYVEGVSKHESSLSKLFTWLPYNSRHRLMPADFSISC